MAELTESQMQTLAFDPADAKAALVQLPDAPAVFALYGAEAHAEPYIGRTPNLRGRLERLLQPSEKHPRRLQLAGRVRQIHWLLTGSEFEGLLAQFSLLEAIYGPKALERMHLGAPSFVRFLGSNAYPRITVTNRPSQREAAWSYGPFPSRAAAERYAEEALKLFLLRRCTEELAPRPDHPGCVYSEMKMCLAPCYHGGRALPGDARREFAGPAPHGARHGFGESGVRGRRHRPLSSPARGERPRDGRRAGSPIGRVARRDSASLRQSRRSGRLPL